MKTRTAIDPRIEVSGAALMSFLQNVNADEVIAVAAKHGLADIQPNKWYPAQKSFAVYDEINHGDNSMADMVAIGMEVVNSAIMPPGFEKADLPTILALWNEHYHLNHRGNVDIGSVATEKVDQKHVKVILTTIYPDDLCYGMTYAYAKRTLPAGTSFRVWYDDSEPRLDEGGSKTVIHVSW